MHTGQGAAAAEECVLAKGGSTLLVLEGPLSSQVPEPGGPPASLP